MIRLRVLGHLDLEHSRGRELTAVLAQPKRLALLAYLAAGERRFHRRDALLACFWPGLDEAHGRSALNQAVRFLRKHLDETEPSIVSRGDEELGVMSDALWCDATAFHEAMSAGHWARALELYRGPLLDGFFAENADGFEEWLEAERRRLRSSAAKAARALAKIHEGEQNVTDAISAARKALDLSDADERVMRELLQLLDRVGDRAGAVHAYETFAQYLTEEFGVEPAAETKLLVAQIRQRQEPQALARRPAPAVPVSRAEPAAPRDAGGAPAPGLPPTQGAPLQTTRRPARRWLPATAVLAIIVGGSWWYAARRGAADAPTPEVIAVLPFRVTASDSTYNYLRDGAVDVLAAGLNGDGLARVIDTRTIVSAYRQAVSDAHRELTAAEAVRLARRLGASRVLMGEFVAARSKLMVSARLLSVPSGVVLAERSESALSDELALTARVGARVLAASVGEAPARLSRLSDSTEAVKAYLGGIQDYRRGHTGVAFRRLSRALEIDSTFAVAALWRAYVAWGAFLFGTVEKRAADSVAWSLRERLSARDKAILASLPSIGPTYPRASTAIELLGAHERAARANPDRAEAWQSWARHLEAWGAQAGVPDHLRLAIIADDSAVALDPSFLPALNHRLYLALLTGDTAAARHYAGLVFADSLASPSMRVALARVLADTATLPALISQATDARRSSPGAPSNLELWSAYYGLASVADAELETALVLARYRTEPLVRFAATRSLFRLSVLRGRFAQARALADSLDARGMGTSFINVALSNTGFDSLGWRTARAMAANADTLADRELAANNLCYSQLWLVSKGDTAGTRRAIARMRQHVRSQLATQGWRVGRLDVCPMLLEAALEHATNPSARSVALDRLENLLLRGILAEAPGNVAYLMAAAWLESRGQHQRALAIIRRRDPMSVHVVHPMSWHMEGRLAAQVGDTAGAVRAWTRYLAIRDQPDIGQVAAEVRGVRERLSAITGGGARR